ncbi:MAG TPA: nuclear transport factor 2 family protein [Pseudolabrys sp.]
MSDSETRATVEALYGAYGWRDPGPIAALLHENIDWVIFGPVDVFAFAGPRHGAAAVLDALAAIAKAFQLESYVPEIVIVEGDRAAVMADVSYKQRATGRTLRIRVADFLRVRDGRVIEFREFFNSFDMVEKALGREIEV